MGTQHLSPAQRREQASKAGKAAHRLGRAHQWTTLEASIAGSKGGATSGARRHAEAVARRAGQINAREEWGL